ncbi:MAG: hypothetical protein RI911_207 [Candidatus Parcubacteria bacterium]|jgi:uncharacterized protein YqeY
MKEAMRAKDTLATDTLRGLMASCTNELIALKRKPTDALSDTETLTVIKRLIKQRKDAAEQFRTGSRADLAEKEDAERVILEVFLPAQASEVEIESVVKAKIAELSVTDKAGAGKLTGAVVKHFAGNADGTLVKQIVDKLLA